MPEYLTTREVAELLRLKERKVYDLVASGALPCSKATGKLLFPRDAITRWIRQHSSGGAQDSSVGSARGTTSASAMAVPMIFLGSHDPLLEWALRESQCGIPTLFESSTQGLDRFVAAEGLASGLHIYESASDSWNTTLVAQRCEGLPVVLTEWVKRQRGMILGEHLSGEGLSQAGSDLGDASRPDLSLADLADYRFVKRQDGAGSQQLLLALLAKENLSEKNLNIVSTEQNEVEAVLRVVEGKADVTFGLQSLAHQFRLPFVPIVKERFDLLMMRHTWFEPPMQKLLSFCRTDEFASYAQGLSGYDVSSSGKVHFNGG